MGSRQRGGGSHLNRPPFVGDLDAVASDIRRQSQLLADFQTWLGDACRNVAGAAPGASRVYLVGCGDSYDVGLAAQLAWERMLGIPVQAMTALAFSRYAVELAPSDSLVVALSQSGRVSRVIEAVRLARTLGANTIAVTGSASSPLASEGNSQIVSPFPKMGSTPGIASYVFNLALFIELGAALADSWLTQADTDRVRSQLASLPHLMDRSAPGVWSVANGHADQTARRGLVHVALGSGPNLATARFFARKLCEIPQLVVVAQDSEEFAHDQYSIVEAGSPILMCSPPGAAADRDDELLISLVNLNAAVAVITDETRTFPEGGSPTWRYDIAAGLDELLTPLLYALPAEVLSYEIAKRIGGSFYAFADETHRRDGDPLIYESAMVERASSR